MTSRRLGIALLAVICLALTTTTFADERILFFHSDITVQSDGGVNVVETIRVQAEGRGIARGIFRDFPTDYKDRLGNRVRVGFDLIDVRRDGAAEPHHTQRQSNGVRVYAGSSDVMLDPGTYEYEIEYRTTRVLGFFDDHDELYWNVTGNGWDFPIDRASASVSLPDTVPAGEVSIEGYTGLFGSTGKNYRVLNDGDQAGLETTDALGPGEGLTLVVTWPKGHVTEPSATDNLAFVLGQNTGLLIGLTSSLTAVIYLVLAWMRVGRDLPPGVVFPHYKPPGAYSPASLRYIAKMRYDQRTFTAAILNLAVKNYIRIEKSDDDYSLTQRVNKDKANLAPGEAVLLAQLFSAGATIALDNKNHRIVSAARSTHMASLQRHHQKRNFVLNGLYLLPAVVILIGASVAIALLDMFTPAVVLVLLAAACAVVLFAWLLKAPTVAGRKLLDEVDGFRMYLEVAEKDELNLNNPPERTPELFEAYLPYALALDVEQPWAEQFASVFRDLENQRGEAYRPTWYSGYWNRSRPVEMTKFVGSSLNSAISSAARAPGSSSGSGGGGSSGGGGGGGGGGGW